MEKYKSSKFNYITSDNEGDLIIYNSLYKRVKKYKKEYKKELNMILKQQYTELLTEYEKNLFEDLKSMQFIVNEATNENAISKYLYLNEITERTLSLIIVPTMQCNFNCPYCYQDHQSAYMLKEIQDAIIKFIKKNIGHYTGVQLAWYGGEPLLVKDTINYISSEVAEICRKRYKPMYGTITTNAYSLDIGTFKKLLSYNIRTFQITLDGMRETHDKQRILKNGKGSFDKIIDNLIQIKNLPSNVNYRIMLRTNVSKDVLETLDEYASYMQGLFGDDARFGFFFRPVQDWGGEIIHEFEGNMLKTHDEQRILYQKLYDSGIKLNYHTYYTDLMENAMCYASKINTYTIELDGKIRKCTCNYSDDDNMIGQLIVDGSMNLDISKTSKWIVGYEHNSKCDECYYEASCHRIFCPAVTVLNNSKDIHCPFGKIDTDWYLKLLSQDERYIKTYEYQNTIE